MYINACMNELMFRDLIVCRSCCDMKYAIVMNRALYDFYLAQEFNY